MPETAAKGKSRSAASRDDGRSEASLPALRVRYYRQMKPQRVYPVEVSWQKSSRPPRGEGKAVTVRLLAAGAQVLPVEQTMDATQPDVKAVFYVTPLAKGWLRNEKLEVLSQGRKVQEIPLATKVVSQRLTWILLLLTFVVPWLILEFVKNSPMNVPTFDAEGRVVHTPIHKTVSEYIKDNVPALPDVVKGTPVETGLREARTMIARGYQQLVDISTIEPIAFYVGAVLLFLTLVSAFLHKQKRRKTIGKPIAVTVQSEDEDEE